MAASGDSPLTPDDIVEALRLARDRDVAPPGLHAQIRAMHEERNRRPAWRGTGVYAGGFATAVAAIVALVILIAPGGTPGGPTLAQAVALSTRAPSPELMATPDADDTGRLDTHVGAVYFPNWARSPLGWRAVGERVDNIGGRRAITVYYRKGSAEVAYTIVSAPALAWPKAPVTVQNDVALQTLTLGGKLVTTWRRGGSTCVLSGKGVSQRVLQKLASW